MSVEMDLRRMNPKQERFFTARERYVAYGGARGGGKSWAVRMKAAMMAMRYPGIRILIVRRTLPELEENHIRQLRELMKDCTRWNEQKKLMTLYNGSVIRFGYCDAERDVLQYQGQEYDCIFIDEATQLTEYQFQTFKGCLRGVNDFPKRMYLTCNPGGVGHAWVKRLFVDGKFQAGEEPEEHVFIPAGVRDNTVLMEQDPGYIKRLESLPYALRAAWLDGRWDVMIGAFFTEWEREVHVIEPFVIPGNWRRYITMDYGMDMLAAYRIAVDEEGNAYVEEEVYEGRDLGEDGDGNPYRGLIISEAAERLKALAGDVSIYEWLAPPDMWNARQETGRSVADIFAEQGIYLTKTGGDRVSGWMALRERLRIREGKTGEKTAGLKIFRGCGNLIRTLPLLQYDPKRPNDCLNEPHELTHGPDAIRGFCVWWVMRAGGVKETKPERFIDTVRPKGQRRRR